MALIHIERTLNFSPTLCSFCQYIISSELERFKVRAENIIYPERDEASSRRSLKKHEECALCEYVIAILDSRGTDFGDGEKAMSRTVRALCYPIAA
jgi:hypothetical protein